MTMLFFPNGNQVMTDINTLIKFESYELNTARRELTNSGVLVEIEPRVFDVLLYSINNHDRVVNKDELQDAIWPGMIDTESALTRAVMKARKAIGDNANRQDLIKTLQGHGYRFIAELSIIKPVAAPSSDALESAQQEKVQTNSTSKTDRVKGSPLTMLAIALMCPEEMFTFIGIIDIAEFGIKTELRNHSARDSCHLLDV